MDEAGAAMTPHDIPTEVATALTNAIVFYVRAELDRHGADATEGEVRNAHSVLHAELQTAVVAIIDEATRKARGE